jgi:hypothetical protein
MRCVLAAAIVGLAGSIANAQEGARVASCVEAVANVESSNGFVLFLGADSCLREGREQDGAFLSWAGQHRSVIDMLMFDPSAEERERVVAGLERRIAPAELYRDEAAAARLIARLRDWRPRLVEGYDPGWARRANPNVENFDFFVGELKPTLVAQLEREVLLMRTDEYYAATTELNEIQRRSPAIEVDSDRGRAEQLKARLLEMRKSVPIVDQNDRRDPNAPFRQVFMGMNGPSRSGWSVFASRREVLGSWVARALSAEELASVLEQVDFDEQVLFSFNVGEAYTATGKVYIGRLLFDSKMRLRGADARVGLNEPGCNDAPGSLYPFALAVFDRAAASAGPNTSVGSATFADGCPTPPAVTPND